MGLSQKEAAAKFGYNSYKSWSFWETGLRKIPEALLYKLKEEGVNPDWLEHGRGKMLLSDDGEAFGKLEGSTFSERLQSSFTRSSFRSVLSFSKEYGIPYTTIQQWIKGKTEPTISTALFLAEKLNVPAGWLVTGVWQDGSPLDKKIAGDSVALTFRLVEKLRLKPKEEDAIPSLFFAIYEILEKEQPQSSADYMNVIDLAEERARRLVG